jgi:hypothetical protein
MEPWKEVLLALNEQQRKAIEAAITPMDIMEANENLNSYLAAQVEQQQTELENENEDPE